MITIEVNGVLRMYDMLWPLGVEYWFKKCAENGRNGVPLVVALHGRGEHPEVLQAQWDFMAVANASTNFRDKFVVLVPYGLGIDDKRSWNSHPQFHPMDPNDVAFIADMIPHAEAILKNYLLSRGVLLGSPAVGFDTKRQHLFGYSSGALMACRLAGVQTDVWTSVVALAASNGARSYKDGTEYRYPPNTPGGTKRTSLWLAVGGLDGTNPAGPQSTPGGGSNPDTFKVSTDTAAALALAGVAAPDDEKYAYAVRRAAWTVKDYLTYLKALFPNFGDDYASPKRLQPGLPGVIGSLRTRREWASASDDNPLVRFDYDENMTHTNLFLPLLNRWMTAADVWAFMRSVERP